MTKLDVLGKQAGNYLRGSSIGETYLDSGQRPIPAQISSPRQRLQNTNNDIFSAIIG